VTGEEAYRKLAEVYNHLTGLALQGADVPTATWVLAECVGQAVAILDLAAEPLAVAAPLGVPPLPAGWPGGDQRLPRTLVTVAETRRAVRLPAAGPVHPPLVAGPIIVAGEILAYVLTIQSPARAAGIDFDLLVTEHAATVFAVVMSRERALADVASQVRDDLVDALLLGRVKTAEDRRRWAEHLGYDPGREHRCLVVAIDGLEAAASEPGGAGPAAAMRRRVHQAAVQVVPAASPRAIVAARRDEVVVIAERDGARELGELLEHRLSARFPRLAVTVGVGGVCSDVDGVSESYEQARRAIRAARSLGQAGQSVAFEDLGIFRLLLQVPDLGELHDFAREVFGELLDYDERRRLGLLRTLSAYLRSGGSLQQAGRELHLHANSVGYRLGRIEEITGLDLRRYEDRLTAQVALKIIEGLEPALLARRPA
jgi:sugar diacid utilization regulator